MTTSPWERKVVEHFDKGAHSYGNSYEGDSSSSYFFTTRQRIIISRLKRLAGGRLLDVACGPGLMAAPCGSRGFRYFGIDISHGMIVECRARSGNLPGAQFSVGKMQKLPFADDYFDVLLCMGGLEYIPAAEELDARREMIRVVKPGGTLMISHLNRHSPYWLWRRFVYRWLRLCLDLARFPIAGPFSARPRGHAVHDVPIRLFTERSSRRVLEGSPVAIAETLYYAFNVFLSPLDSRFPHLSNRVSEKLECLRNSPLKWLAMAFIMVLTKN